MLIKLLVKCIGSVCITFGCRFPRIMSGFQLGCNIFFRIEFMNFADSRSILCMFMDIMSYHYAMKSSVYLPFKTLPEFNL